MVFLQGNGWKLHQRVRTLIDAHAPPGPVLVSLDSLHSYENVLAELHRFAPFVRRARTVSA